MQKLLQVPNSKCIRRLGFRSLRASRQRNIVAVLAIALTTVLFTSLFTIAASINYSLQQENFRQAGGDAHASVKDITYEQTEALREDSLIKASWSRLMVGFIEEPPFNKSHVEVSYIEPAGASHYFCTPTVGALPQEGTNEVATDTHILALLGIEPELGARLTLPIIIDSNTNHPQTIERSFTLSGWWDYDNAVVANHVLLPRSAAEELVALSNNERGTFTGMWNLDMMFKNASAIQDNLNAVLANQGYQCTDTAAANYLKIGINWGYTGQQISKGQDPLTTAAIAAILLLIILAGYLIIYNVFQISVTNDIRFYGLLKTIGATGRQLKRIIRQQALCLSALGIPLGLVPGFLIGNQLTPVIMDQLSYKNAFVSFNPWIFLGAAAFSLLTVFLSCARPGRIAARVSPIEAVRYTEGASPKASKKSIKRSHGASLPQMAWANLRRSPGKTLVTILSLTLAVVLMNLVFTFANGFDMEKYLSGKVVTDYVVAHADYFQSSGFHSTDQAVSEEIIADINAQGGVTAAGRIYGQERSIQQLMPEAYFRSSYQVLYDEETIKQITAAAEKTPSGLLAGDAQLYGMEDFPLSCLNLLEGDLAPLSDPTQRAIAMVYSSDDYNQIRWDSNWGQIGDTVTLRYITQWTYIDLNTGEEISNEEVEARFNRGEENFASRAKTYEEQTYTVCALVEVPSALSYRYRILGASQLIMGAQRFLADTKMDSVMLYALNTTTEAQPAMNSFLADYTETSQPFYSYESKQSIIAEFAGFRNMFLTMGSALAAIIGLVGVLNYTNAVLTGILARKRELAVLQSVGMTGRQLKTMLVFEGLYYTMLSAVLSLLLSAALGPLSGSLCNLFWFFTYRFTVLPVLAVLPVFLLLGIVVPLLTYRSVARHTIVERLREAEC